jgi:hypothetical protein
MTDDGSAVKQLDRYEVAVVAVPGADHAWPRFEREIEEFRTSLDIPMHEPDAKAPVATQAHERNLLANAQPILALRKAQHPESYHPR